MTTSDIPRVSGIAPLLLPLEATSSIHAATSVMNKAVDEVLDHQEKKRIATTGFKEVEQKSLHTIETLQRNLANESMGILIGTWKGCKIDANQRQNGLGNTVYYSIDARQRIHRRAAKLDYLSNLILLESREIPKSSYYKYEDILYLPRYRDMSKLEVNVAVERQLMQAQRLARARARAAESKGGTTAFGTDQGGL